MKHKEVLLQAAKTIDVRGNEYGDMVENHARIARLFNDMVPDVKLQPHHVAACLMAVKLARIYANPTHDDSYVDLSAYAAFRAELVATNSSGGTPLENLIASRKNSDARSRSERIDQAALNALKNLDDLDE